MSSHTLQEQNISGQVLDIGLTESEMEASLDIRTLGDRRRLSIQLQRLRAGQGLFGLISRVTP